MRRYTFPLRMQQTVKTTKVNKDAGRTRGGMQPGHQVAADHDNRSAGTIPGPQYSALMHVPAVYKEQVPSKLKREPRRNMRCECGRKVEVFTRGVWKVIVGRGLKSDPPSRSNSLHCLLQPSSFCWLHRLQSLLPTSLTLYLYPFILLIHILEKKDE